MISFDFSTTGQDLLVNVSHNIPTKLGNKSRAVNIEAVAGVEHPNFKNSGSIIVFEVPPSFASPI